jgi:hypothetical protein
MSPAWTVAPATTRIDVEVNAGDLFDLYVPILDANLDPVEILDADTYLWAAHATVRRNALSTAVLHDWSSTAETPTARIVAGNPAEVRLIATPTQTALWQTQWPSLHAGWDLDLVEPQQLSGDIDQAPTPIRIAHGRFTVVPQFAR